MSARTFDELNTPEDYEEWMLAVGYKRENGKLDHERAMNDAKVKSTWATVKLRWKKGEAPEDRLKITAALIDADRKQKQLSEWGRKAIALERWDALALDLLGDVSIFEEQIRQAEPAAVAAKASAEARAAQKRADALRAGLAFKTATPRHGIEKRTRK